MVFDFLIQFSLSLLFAAGLAGVGTVILKALKITQQNKFLALALAFFVSLCVYVAGSVFLLFIFPNPLKVLSVYSIIYGLASAAVLFKYIYCKEGDFFTKECLLKFFNENWVVLISAFFVVIVFFMGIYKTALLDEGLHRPVINFFLANNEFPLKDPHTPGIDFTSQYHYGLDIAGAVIALLSKSAVSEALDIMKISFVIASYFLFFGILFEWSKKKVFSATGAMFLLLSGASFFFLDGFSASHWFVWGEQLRTMNYPLLYVLMGITWVNLPLSVVFLILLEELFYKRSDYKIKTISILAILFVGFYLISELFSALFILAAAALFLYNIYKKRIASAQIFFSCLLFLIMLIAIYFSQGVILNIVKTMDFTALLSIRPFHLWGYPSETSIIINPFWHSFFYLRNFLLEIVIVILLFWALIKKKIKIAENPLMFCFIAITFLIPFIFSTYLGDINLYKITHLGIILLHLLIFYYLAKNFEIKTYVLLIILFLFGSVPTVFVNYNIFTKSTVLGAEISCVQNELCYEKDAVNVLRELQKKDPAIKYVFAGSQDDMQKVVDLSNSYVFMFDFDFKNWTDRAQYFFISPESRKNLKKQQRAYIKSLERVSESGEYAVYAVK